MAIKTLISPASQMGHCKMTWQLRMSVSQKLASWKGSAEDAKAGKYKIRVNPRNLRLISLRAFCAFLWLINPFNQRNPRLINYLHAFGIFTLVKKSLQIRLFMQNEANFRKSQMNVNKVLTRDYEKRTLGESGKNEPKTNPIKANSNPIKANIMPKQSQNEPNQTQPVVSLPALSEVEGPALPVLSLSKGAKSKGSNLFQTHLLSTLFLFFTFLGPGYNLPMQNWTIQRLLNWITEYFTEKGIDSPRLSAELLLSNVLTMKRIELYTQFDKLVDKEQLNRLHGLVKRAGQHEPIAYLTGRTEFYSLQLEVCPDCMIPRPETELVVERAIEFLRTRPVRNSAMHNMARKQDVSNGARTGPQFVCDLCTGCGCIAVAIAKNFPDAKIIATDICDAALNIAAKNVEKYNLKNRITLLSGDLFEPLVPHLDVEKPVRHSPGNGGFDLIVCNPPYVSAAEYEKLEKNVKDYEPRLALFAGVDGLDVYRRIIDKADQFLKSDAALMLEIGYAQGKAIREMLEQAGTFAEIKIEKDFHDNDRVVTALRASS